MALCEKILITGFSGSGKTTLMKELKRSAPAKWLYLEDLDDLVLKNHGKNQYQTLADLIEKEGWENFRLWERQELEIFLKTEGFGVISLGGGTLNPALIQMYSITPKLLMCHLDADFKTCWTRLELDTGEPRPLVSMGKVAFERLYRERQNLFRSIPWRLQNSEGNEISEVASSFWKTVS